MGFMGCPTESSPDPIGQRPRLGGTASISGSYNVATPFVAITSNITGSGSLTLRWQISDSFNGDFTDVDSGDGTLTAIAGITNAFFTPAVGAAQKFVRLVVTRENYTGSVTSLPYKILAAGVSPVVTGVEITHPFTPSSLMVVKGGDPIQLSAEVTGTDVGDIQYVSWAIVPPYGEGTNISVDGLLTVGNNEDNNTLTIRAVSLFNTARSSEAVAYISSQNWSEWQGPDGTELPAVRTGPGVYFIAPDGNDSTGDGSILNPWRTIGKANQNMAGGDTLYIRGGTYNTTSAQSLNVSGVRGSPTLYSAYPPDLEAGNRPVFDFGGGTGSVGINGSWIHLYGIDVTNTEVFATGTTPGRGGGIGVGSSHTTVEYCRTYRTGGIGLGGNYNLVKNNDIFHNASFNNLLSNMNHDGSGQHYSGNVGNVYYGNRAWCTTDDGFDTLSCFTTVVIERNWHAYSGHYYPENSTYEDWTTSFAKAEVAKYNYGRGNGFKIGGFNMNNQLSSDRLTYGGRVHQVVRFNLAIGCRNAGISHNFHWGGSYFSYNTAWNNNDNFDFMKRKGTAFISTSNNTQDASRVVNNADIVATGNIAFPGGPGNTGFNVAHLDYDSGLISAFARANGMQEPHGAGQRQIWNNSWELVDNGATATHGEANWIEGIMLHGMFRPAPDLWTGEPWPTTKTVNGVTYNFISPSVDGGSTTALKDIVYFPRGMSGPRGTAQNPRLAWDEYGYWNNWDDKTRDIVQNAKGMTEADFMSFDENLFFTPRKKNGDLPDIALLRPVPGSVVDSLGYTAEDNDYASGATGEYRFHLWKYRAGANPTLDDSLNPINP
jgi:hypothetical protein